MANALDPELRPFLEELELPNRPWTMGDLGLLGLVVIVASAGAFLGVTLLVVFLRWTLAADYGPAASRGPVLDGAWRWGTALVAGALAAIAVVSSRAGHGRPG